MESWPPSGGFAERVFEKRSYCSADLAKEVAVLTLEHLDFLIVLIAGTKKVGQGEMPDDVYVTMGVSYEIIRFFMGDAWTNENAFGCHTEVSPGHREGRKYLLSESLDDEGKAYRHQTRVSVLAECLYNLQGIDGAKQRMALLQSDDLEATLGEFRCAKIISHPDLKLRFIMPTGKKGMDYEAEIVTATGRVVCCEIKTKKEATELSFATTWNTLESARKQLPKDKPGVIFLTIPETWSTQPNSNEIIESAVKKILRQSNRLVAIVIAWEVWWEVAFGGRFIEFKFEPIFNQKSIHFSGEISETFARFGSINNNTWLNLPAYVSTRLPFLIDATLAHVNRRQDATQAPGPPPT